MTSPLVEIFVLSYNRADYLRDCIRSILNQTFIDFTVIVLDNHSEEDITGVVDSFRDPRIKLIVNSKNIGGPANCAQAIEMASGDYMMIFHDDDCLSPRVLERQIRLFEQYPYLSQVSAGINFVFQHEKMLEFNDEEDFSYKIYETPSSLVFGYFFDKEGFSFSSIMYRTMFAKQVRINVERFANVGDRPYVLDVMAFGPFVCMSRPNYNVRIHSEQDSGIGATWEYLNEMELVRHYLDITNGSHTRPLVRAAMSMLVVKYINRQPRASFKMWLKAMKERRLLYWDHLIVLFPYLFLRNFLKLMIVGIVPDKYYQYFKACIRG
jgi:glycosyltransferase involved in cell wall biosynthesis